MKEVDRKTIKGYLQLIKGREIACKQIEDGQNIEASQQFLEDLKIIFPSFEDALNKIKLGKDITKEVSANEFSSLTEKNNYNFIMDRFKVYLHEEQGVSKDIIEGCIPIYYTEEELLAEAWKLYKEEEK